MGEILLDLYRTSGSFRYRGPAAFKRWLGVLVLNRVRKAVRSRNVDRSPSGRRLVSLDRVEHPHDRLAGDPSRILEDREADRTLRPLGFLLLFRCLAGIRRAGALEARALRLHEFRGLTYHELGEALGLDRAATAALVRRARRRVLAFLKTDPGSPGG